ncbi:hypothetical protein EYS14_12575 [Alteromonadaceae bacterium M269]|nr:hypothetical protein EYS14_12575 [Alteromonadaceae bacterium M269]
MSNGFVYAKIYDCGIEELCKLTKKEILLFLYLATKAKMSNNELQLTKSEKERAARTIEVSVGSIGNYLSKLCKLNFMQNTGGGCYLLNPTFANRAKLKHVSVLSSQYYLIKQKSAQ